MIQIKNEKTMVLIVNKLSKLLAQTVYWNNAGSMHKNISPRDSNDHPVFKIPSPLVNLPSKTVKVNEPPRELNETFKVLFCKRVLKDI